jgi:hypothetical protein
MERKTTLVGGLIGVAVSLGVLYGIFWAASKGWSAGKN